MRAPHVRPVVAATLALVAVLAGCSSGSSNSSAGTSTSASSTTTTSEAASSTSSTAAPTSSAGAPTSSTTAPSNRCHTSQLTAGLGTPQGAAGSTYLPVTLTNHSSTTCVINGYPGVSLLDASGHAIGTPATRASGQPAKAVTLPPGAVSSTTVRVQNPGLGPGGCWPPSARIKIYPPDELDALSVGGVITVCGNAFSVTPMATAGEGG